MAPEEFWFKHSSVTLSPGVVPSRWISEDIWHCVSSHLCTKAFSLRELPCLPCGTSYSLLAYVRLHTSSSVEVTLGPNHLAIYTPESKPVFIARGTQHELQWRTGELAADLEASSGRGARTAASGSRK